MGSRNLIADGWNVLHQAALDRGAEVDYEDSDYPSLKGIRHVDRALYTGLVSPLIELSNVDIELFGMRADLLRRAIWRWIRRTAERDAPQAWQNLCAIKSRTALLAAFQETAHRKCLHGQPRYSTSDPFSVIRFGYWLLQNGKVPGEPKIVSVIWGLAIVGVEGREHLRCGVCKLCFRRSRPGGMYCDAHSQCGTERENHSEAYIRYRRGRIAQQLDLSRPEERPRMHFSPAMLHSIERLTIPDVLFPMETSDQYDDQDLEMLVYCLEQSSRVVAFCRVRNFRRMPRKALICRLRTAIDPHNWSNNGWGLTVLQAERWLALEAEASPGTRGKGKKTTAMVKAAIDLVREGKSNSQLSRELGVSPSTVTRWIDRYPEFAQATLERNKNLDCNPQEIGHSP